MENGEESNGSIIDNLTLMLGLAVFPHMGAWGGDWRLYTTSRKSDGFYYDLKSIRRISKDLVRVWVKRIVSEKTIQDLKEKWGSKFKDTRNDVYLQELNCSEMKFRILTVTMYDLNGSILKEISFASPPWDFVVPQSNEEPLFNTICKP